MKRLTLGLLVSIVLFTLAVAVYAAVVDEPSYADTSRAYAIGYEVVVQYGGANVTVAEANASMGLGPRVGGVMIYNDLGNASSLIIPPPASVTVTNTTTYTITETITRTITLPSGETTVVTEVQTVSIQENSRIDPKLAGLGALAALIILIVLLRG